MDDKSLYAELEKSFRAVFGELADTPLFPAPDTVEPTRTQAGASLSGLQTQAASCTECRLHLGREKSAFGRGPENAELLFLGDIPSENDNRGGKVFSDAAGELLDKMIVAMKRRPESCYFMNLVPCRPSNAQAGDPELRKCESLFLKEIIRTVRPRYIIALGERTARFLAGSDSSLQTLRGQEFSYEDAKLFVTHHPRDLLENTVLKKQAWEDLQFAMKQMS